MIAFSGLGTISALPEMLFGLLSSLVFHTTVVFDVSINFTLGIFMETNLFTVLQSGWSMVASLG